MTTLKRTTTPTKVPGIPKPPTEISAGLRRYLENLSEAVEIRLGRRGDQRDRAITLRELIDSGLAVELTQKPFDPNTGTSTFVPPNEEVPDTTVPPAPVNFRASAAFSTVILFWDKPLYRNHSFTEIWRHDEDIIGDAQLVGVSSAISFVDPVGEGTAVYYWARHVSDTGIIGPFHAVNGEFAETAPDVEYLLELLTNSITESQLYEDLGARINLIDGDANLEGSVAYLLAQEAAARAAALAAEAAARAAAIQATSNSLQNLISEATTAPAYDNATTYSSGDLVVYNGSLYKALSTTTGNLPTNTNFWELLGAFTSLVDFAGQNSASIVELNNVSATSTSANASALFGLQSTVTDPDTGLPATRATLFNDYYTSASTDLAISSATAGLASTSYVTNALGNYVTNATLTTNYYTRTDTNSAISAATTNLVSNTDLTNTLGSYATNATLTNNYYTQADTNSAISAATTNLVSNTDLTNTLGSYVTNATLTNNYYTQTDTNSAISSAVSTLSATVGANTAALQVAAQTINGLEAQYTVKIDNNGYVSGFGLASTPVDGTPFSEFIVRADRFAIASPGQVEVVPFVVTTSTTTLNGESVPPGVYIDQAYIKNGAISEAKIGTLSADKITTGELGADRIGASTITATKLAADAVTAEKLAISSATDGTASSIYMDSNGAIKVYDASGTLRVKLGNLGA